MPMINLNEIVEKQVLASDDIVIYENNTTSTTVIEEISSKPFLPSVISGNNENYQNPNEEYEYEPLTTTIEMTLSKTSDLSVNKPIHCSAEVCIFWFFR